MEFKNLHIVGMVAENVKKLRLVEITPKGHLIQITGKNGQGKTSVLDAVWMGLVGKPAIPEKPVRKGADKARIRLDLGDLVVTRTIAPNRTTTLTVESKTTGKFTSPQQVLDELLGQLTFDPLAFAGMHPKDQLNALRSVVKIELDIAEIDAQNKVDFDARTVVNRDVERLKAEAGSITVQADLPKARQDEKPLLEVLESAGARNIEARRVDESWNELQQKVQGAAVTVDKHTSRLAEAEKHVQELERELAEAKKRVGPEREWLAGAENELQSLNDKLAQAPRGEFVDVSDATKELQRVQLINREIDKRTRKEEIEKRLRDAQKKSDGFTRAIEDRNERKRTAIANAEMPVPGLTFDEEAEAVLLHGIPLDQLGDAEQIRISTSIAMAANPKLRILRIDRGEALDEDALSVLAEMAEANDFQIWMSRVDSSGKVGIVMEDGSVKEGADDEAQ